MVRAPRLNLRAPRSKRVPHGFVTVRAEPPVPSLASVPTNWDYGATVWDYGATTWDTAAPEAPGAAEIGILDAHTPPLPTVWDDGTTSWDDGKTVWLTGFSSNTTISMIPAPRYVTGRTDVTEFRVLTRDAGRF